MTDHAFSEFSLDDPVPDVPNGLSEEVTKRIQLAVRKQDPYPMEETSTRNLIMLGRSGSGKTTAINIIKDICAKPQPRSLFSDTVGARFQSFSLDDKRGKKKYTINIIDTPGVAEVKPMGIETRSDSTILETVKFCLKNEITRVHSLFIFAAFGERINELDRNAFRVYLEMFDNPNVSIAFCITKSENLTPSECEKIIEDLKQEEFFSKVLEKQNVRVFFTGSVDEALLRTVNDERQLFNLYSKIHKKREALVKFVFDTTEDGVMLFELPIISSSFEQMRNHFDKLDEYLKQLSAVKDFKTGTSQRAIEEFNVILDELKANDGLFANKDMYNKFVDLKTSMLALKPKMDNDSWRALSSSIIFG